MNVFCKAGKPLDALCRVGGRVEFFFSPAVFIFDIVGRSFGPFNIAKSSFFNCT